MTRAQDQGQGSTSSIRDLQEAAAEAASQAQRQQIMQRLQQQATAARRASGGGKQASRGIPQPNKRQVTDGSRITAIAAGAGRAASGCRRSPACALASPKPASATRTGPTCWSPCSSRAPRSPVASPPPSRARRRSTGDRANLANGTARAFLVNAGNANAFTGAAGVKTVASTVAALASIIQCPPEEVFRGIDRGDRRAARSGADQCGACPQPSRPPPATIGMTRRGPS